MARKLWKHQQEAYDRFKDSEYFGLLFSMGCGKTNCTIRIAEHKDRPVLIIAPNAICKQWEKDLHDKEQCEKEWEVVLCTSKTKKRKNFKELLDNLLR